MSSHNNVFLWMALASVALASERPLEFDPVLKRWVRQAPTTANTDAQASKAPRTSGYPTGPAASTRQPPAAARGPINKNDVPTIVMIGKTGNGKSNLANMLIGDLALTSFKVCDPRGPDAMRSQTIVTTAEERDWNPEGLPASEAQPRVLVIDTPGLNDTEGRDDAHLKAMVAKIKEEDKNYGGISKFLITMMYGGPGFKFDSDMMEMMKTFMDAVQGDGTGVNPIPGGPAGLRGNDRKKQNLTDFFGHVCFVFTGWEENDSARRRRRRTTKEDVRREYRMILQEKVNELDISKNCGFTMTDPIRDSIECYFIDSMLMTEERDSLDAPENSAELKAYQDELMRMWRDFKRSPKYSCNDIRPVAVRAPKIIEKTVHVPYIPQGYVHVDDRPTPAAPAVPERNKSYNSMDAATRAAYDGDKNIRRVMNHYNTWDLAELKGKKICCSGSFLGTGHFHGIIDKVDLINGVWIFQGGENYEDGDDKTFRLTKKPLCKKCGPYQGPGELKGLH